MKILNNQQRGSDGFFGKKPGSALILTMFIMAGMLLAAMSGAYVVLLGIKTGGIQAQSTKAYFAAEAGAEKLLWEMRKNSYSYGSVSETAIFSQLFFTGASYDVYFIDFPPLVFQSIGDYHNTRRSVEIRM
ncbi:MAG: hypothetical protein WC146_02445 [Patescibacteria group bacterium]|jgi:hypothetical protein